MGKHTADKPEASQSAVDKRRKAAIEKFFDLTQDAIKHIKWSLAATKPCTSCNLQPDGTIKAGKAKDAEGKCAFCHNEGVIPNETQRNWATEEIVTRVAPAPKAIEATIDEGAKVKELEAEVSKLEDKDLNAQLKILGVKIVTEESE